MDSDFEMSDESLRNLLLTTIAMCEERELIDSIETKELYDYIDRLHVIKNKLITPSKSVKNVKKNVVLYD